VAPPPQPAVEEEAAVDIAVAGKRVVDMPVVDRPAAEKRVAGAADRAVAAVADRRAAADTVAEDIEEDIGGTADIAAAVRKADKAAAAQASLPAGAVVDKRAAAVAAVVLQRRP